MGNVPSKTPKKEENPYFLTKKVSMTQTQSVLCKDEHFIWWGINSKYYDGGKKGKGRVPSRLEIHRKKTNFKPSAFNIDTFILYGYCAYIAVSSSNTAFNQNRRMKNMSREVEILRWNLHPPFIFHFVGFVILILQSDVLSWNIIYSWKFPKYLLTRDKGRSQYTKYITCRKKQETKTRREENGTRMPLR